MRSRKAQPELASEGWAFLERHRITVAALIAAGGSFGLLRLAFRRGTWTPALVLSAMGMALRRLLIFTAALAMARGTPHAFWAALLILGGYPISYGLRRLFPPS